MSPEQASGFQLLATTILGIVGVVVASLQYAAMRQQKWIQLFDRRYKVYRDLAAVAGEVGMTGKISEESKGVIRETAHLSRILFGKRFDQLAQSLWLIAYYGVRDKVPPNRRGEIWQQGFEKEPSDLFAEHWEAMRPMLLKSLQHWRE